MIICVHYGKDTNIASFDYSNIAFCCDTIYSEEDMNPAKEQLVNREFNPNKE